MVRFSFRQDFGGTIKFTVAICVDVLRLTLVPPR